MPSASCPGRGRRPCTASSSRMRSWLSSHRPRGRVGRHDSRQRPRRQYSHRGANVVTVREKSSPLDRSQSNYAAASLSVAPTASRCLDTAPAALWRCRVAPAQLAATDAAPPACRSRLVASGRLPTSSAERVSDRRCKPFVGHAAPGTQVGRAGNWQSEGPVMPKPRVDGRKTAPQRRTARIRAVNRASQPLRSATADEGNKASNATTGPAKGPGDGGSERADGRTRLAQKAAERARSCPGGATSPAEPLHQS